ncbi:hypothetical protein NOVOSPHI9U_610005 [Novosphingobium sp. 9U]|nr:hypothetical protein NOVOSPHI9U_610005 [Novosphingobium sp. 9U]
MTERQGQIEDNVWGWGSPHPQTTRWVRFQTATQAYMGQFSSGVDMPLTSRVKQSGS